MRSGSEGTMLGDRDDRLAGKVVPYLLHDSYGSVPPIDIIQFHRDNIFL